MNKEEYLNDAVTLLRKLIATPSVSREENRAADLMEEELRRYGFRTRREANNVWAMTKEIDMLKPTLLLNAHIDTVKPVASWTMNPYHPDIIDDTLYGLGSNDCGGGLMSLLQAFRVLSRHEQPYNLIYLATAEEEVTGVNGMRRVLPLLPKIDVAIVGEPTGMQPAIAEKGLMVLDIVSHGQSGHAARNEGVNAIYEALDDLNWLCSHKFKKVSPLLGPTLMNVTMINAGTQHNVVPDECHIVVDIRTNEYYENEYVLQYIKNKLKSDVLARSTHLHSSSIPADHPIVARLIDMGKQPYGSPTLSDQSVMSFPSLKLGPGESARSHTANEFIKISEIEDAIDTYVKLLDQQPIA
ncbi:MAG: M20 family metallo-hydrolase [Prevotella sp.]|nr:M20 family metallo-hydrolase [Prevotella sp.]